MQGKLLNPFGWSAAKIKKKTNYAVLLITKEKNKLMIERNKLLKKMQEVILSQDKKKLLKEVQKLDKKIIILNNKLKESNKFKAALEAGEYGSLNKKNMKKNEKMRK